MQWFQIILQVVSFNHQTMAVFFFNKRIALFHCLYCNLTVFLHVSLFFNETRWLFRGWRLIFMFNISGIFWACSFDYLDLDHMGFIVTFLVFLKTMEFYEGIFCRIGVWSMNRHYLLKYARLTLFLLSWWEILYFYLGRLKIEHICLNLSAVSQMEAYFRTFINICRKLKNSF